MFTYHPLSELFFHRSYLKTTTLTKNEEPSLPYYLLLAGGRIIGFIPFPRVLVLCEMQSATSRIWTCVTVSISYDDNHYTMGSSYKNIKLLATLVKADPKVPFSFHLSGGEGFICLCLQPDRTWH